MATVSDPLGEEEAPVRSPSDGVLIGRTNLPLVHEGDALFHIAVFEHHESVADEVDYFQGVLDLNS